MSFEMSTSAAATNQVLALHDIRNEIFFNVSKVQLHLQVNFNQSLTILLKFKWDIDTLKESFHASQDLSDFLVSNNITLKSVSVALFYPECQLCLAVEDVKGLLCRHMACDSCWRTYLRNKIEFGNPSIECFGCSLLICSDKLETLLGSTELLTAYQDLVVNNYISNDYNLTWCSKKCGNAVRRTDSNKVSCSCGANFCFQCKLDPHCPASCEQVRLWKRACEEHAELGKFADKKSWKWIQDNTVECPKCSAPIQKNGGCIHMYCEKCKHDFCWNCLLPWDYVYHGYVCNRDKTRYFRPNEKRIAPYWLPFNYHKGKKDDSSEISECRQVLMYSYVFAYYQGPGKITRKFKQFQKKLRDELDLEKSRRNPQKCEKLRKSILDHCILRQKEKEVGKKKTKKCCWIVCVVFLVLLLCFILAAIFTLTVFPVSLFM